MKIITIKTLLQTTAVLFTSIVLLGCPIDDDDIFTGDVTVNNNRLVNFDHVSIETGATGANLGVLIAGNSVTYSGYDCATNYTNTILEAGGVLGVDDQVSVPFIPPCGGTETINWN